MIVETVKDNMDYYDRNLEAEIEKEEKLKAIGEGEIPIKEGEDEGSDMSQ